MEKSFSQRLKAGGKKYINRSGKTVDEKKPKIVDCSKCRFKCSSFFAEDQRESLCKEYYGLADYRRQKYI